ncbi:MAG: HAMP domain-containing histidine kinase [Desulfamplus sp.]|nr:HAMP domain-containing histidine kinase [Desulfamplus sp.]
MTGQIKNKQANNGQLKNGQVNSGQINNGQLNSGEHESLSIGNSGLQYFGSMSASIAHEIKNALAITNENAGLMEDLSLMVIKSGQPLDPERIAKLSRKVMDQVKRADEIVKKMSRFAHSVDDPVKVINLTELLDLTLDLGRRSASAYGVTLAPVQCEIPISVQTNPFILMNLLWLVIKSASTRVNSDKQLQISVSKEQKKVRITITNLIKTEDATQDAKKISAPNKDEIIYLANFLDIELDMKQEREIILLLAG